MNVFTYALTLWREYRQRRADKLNKILEQLKDINSKLDRINQDN